MQKQKGISTLIIIIIIIAIVVIAVSGVFAYKYYFSQDRFAGWKVYKDNDYNFEFRYPSNYIIGSYCSVTDGVFKCLLEDKSVNDYWDDAIIINATRHEELKDTDMPEQHKYVDVYNKRSIENIFQNNYTSFGNQYFETADGLKRGVSYFEEQEQSAIPDIRYNIKVVNKNGDLISVLIRLENTKKVIDLSNELVSIGHSTVYNPNAYDKFYFSEIPDYFNSLQARKDIQKQIDELQKIVESSKFNKFSLSEYNQKQAQEKADIVRLAAQVENWSLYKDITNKNDKNVDFEDFDCKISKDQISDYENKVAAGNMKVLNVNNAVYVYMTPNYEGWTESEFPCSANGVVGGKDQLYAYPDKLLWVTGCNGQEMSEEEGRKCSDTLDAIFAYFKNKNQNQQTNNVQTTDQTTGWKTYTNNEYGFEFKYPQNLIAEEQGPSYATILIDKKETSELSTLSSVRVKNIPFTVTPNYNRARKMFSVLVQPLETCNILQGLGYKINNITFNIRSGAWEKGYAMGPEWQSGKAYDVVHNNLCYSIILEIDGSDTPTPNYDFKTEQLSLEKMAETFKFTK